MSSGTTFILVGTALFLLGVGAIYWTHRNRDEILRRADVVLDEAKVKRREILMQAVEEKARLEERNQRLKVADKDLVARLNQTRKRIDNLTDICCERASEIELITEEDLLSSKEYQEDRKRVKAELKELACNTIINATGKNSNVNIGKYVTIAAKADMAGALLLTTVEMLCSKTNHNNGHTGFEKLFESIAVTEALVKAIDSRAEVDPKFVALLEERLKIEVDYKRARQVAKESQKEIRDQAREEQRARREAEKAEATAVKEEEIKKAAIAEIEAKMLDQGDAQRALFETELEQLRLELQEAHENSERARSRAQDTKQGHVYIISNIGSFGAGVLKVGMTRRLNPLDRVKELGDASVPFSFDVHALIESDDAPALENALHQALDDQRVNKVNRRKEYFHTSIDHIETRLSKMGIDALISKVPSADEYYQSIKAAS